MELMSIKVWNRIKYEETYVEASECLILDEILKNLECVGNGNGLNYRLPISRGRVILSEKLSHNCG